MPSKIIFNKRIGNFNKKIIIPGDKSLSIRWVLISSLSNGVSKAQNLLFSEDVMAAVEAVRKLGIKVIIDNKMCKIYGKGIDGYRYKKNLTVNAKNSGTLGRLILGILIDTPIPIKMIGDKSLSIRWVLISSLSNGVSKAQNLLFSEDVLAAIEAVRKFGIKVIVNNKMCKIYGKGIDGYRYKKKPYC